MPPPQFIDLISDDESEIIDRKPKLRRHAPLSGAFSALSPPPPVNRTSGSVDRRSLPQPQPSTIAENEPIAKPQIPGGISAEHTISEPQIKNGPRKRTAKDAFGRNGVSELIDRLLQGQADQNKPASGTPGRTSMKDLLARAGTSSDDESQNKSPIGKRARSKPPSNPTRVQAHLRPSSNSVASLVQRAEADASTQCHVRTKPSVLSNSASSKPHGSSEEWAKHRSTTSAGRPPPNISQGFKSNSGDRNDKESFASTLAYHQASSSDTILSKAAETALRTSNPQHAPRSEGQRAEIINDEPRISTQRASRLTTSNLNVRLQKPTSQERTHRDHAAVNNALSIPPPVSASTVPKANVASSSSSITHEKKTNSGNHSAQVDHSAQRPSFRKVPAIPNARSTTPLSPILVDRPRTASQNSPLLSLHNSPQRGTRLTSPSTPRMPDLAPLEGLGTSPRLIRIEESETRSAPQASVPLVSMNHPDPRHMSRPLPPQKASAAQSFGIGNSGGVETADIIRQSIEIAPPELPAALAQPRPDSSGKSKQPPAPNNRKRRFYNSQLATRKGRPWTDAEVILAAYVYEVLQWKWDIVDVKMGRTYNSCATKYCRIPTGLKSPGTRIKMRFHERSQAIEAVLRTMDLDMESVVAHLQTFINTGQLPEQARAEYERLILQNPVLVDTVPFHRPVRDSIVVSKSSRNSPASGSDNGATIATTRRRRGMVDESATLSGTRLRPAAQLTDGQSDIYSSSRRLSTPDSVLASDEDHELPRKRVVEPNKQPEPRLFDGFKDSDEEMTRLYVQRKRPYLSMKERSFLAKTVSKEDANAWQDTTLHMDFDLIETATIVEAVKAACAELYHSSYRGRPQKMLAHATNAQIAAIAACAIEDDRLSSRTRHSVKSFLHDVKSGQSILRAKRLRIARTVTASVSEKVAPSAQRLSRELGLRSSRKNDPKRNIRDAIFDTMTVTRTFTGASGDVGNLAWSRDGRYFAAGSACLVDPSSMQYNQPNNLLFGNLEQNALYEVPDHHRLREKPVEGVNSTHSMHVSQDPRLFETVSMVDFSRNGDMLFTVGYDDHLRGYTLNSDRGNCSLLTSHNHNAKIDLLDVNTYHNVLATGSQSIDASIKVFGFSPEGVESFSDFSSKRAQNLIERRIMPSALRWGVAPPVSRYLLAGFSSAASLEVNAQSAYGEFCLWDVEKNVQVQVAPAAGNIFDANWNPASSHIVAACAAYGTNVNRGTKSVVRVYNALQDTSGLRWTSRGLEMECPALDINDVLFNPYNDRQVAAGATDGSVYIWDLRRPDDILHRFCHGDPVMPLDPNWSREVLDTGVRFCVWGDRAARLYTGSSDGVVRVWDSSRAAEDALVKDAATFNSGVMSGAFTEDFSKLLIGEVDGSINLLEIGADPTPKTEMERFTLRPYDAPSSSATATSSTTAEVDPDSGIALSRALIEAGKIEIKPFGGLPKSQAVRGPNYSGPFDYSDVAERNRDRAKAFQDLYRVDGEQCGLAACREAGRHFRNEDEEVEDSERSKDRIPQAMRDALAKPLSSERKASRVPTTALTCTHCSAPARVREDDMSQAAFPLCERCSFACLRCGRACKKISPALERMSCASCGVTWDIGVLGYTAAQSGVRGRTVKRSQEEVEKHGIPLHENDDANSSGALGRIGDLLDLVSEWHHSLWGTGDT